MLTQAELSFLGAQRLSVEDLYDGRGQSKDEWQAGASLAGRQIVIGSPCKGAGHRLRTRAGHCIQCDTKKIAYQRRHDVPGYVYIAGSRSAQLIKIGTAIDVESRERNLCLEAYGGTCDWKILFHVKVNSAGKIEGDALRGLRQFRKCQAYLKDWNSQQASELLQTTFKKAINAIKIAIGDSERTDAWISPACDDYEFEN